MRRPCPLPRPRRYAVLAAGALLVGCAALPPAPVPIADAAPSQWQAALPHGGTLSDLSRWWQQFDDPLLPALIDAAEAVSPTLASAQSRLAQARATRVASSAALLPRLDGSASVQRGRQDFVTPLGTIASAGLQASWEPDVFGGNRAARNAAQARLDGAQAAWHDARVSVAAEVAGAHVALRACEAQRQQAAADSASRDETARLTALTAKAGFESPANEALSRASAAQGRSQLTAQQAACDVQVKALVALTGIDEPQLRSRLASRTGLLPQPQQIAVATVPAQALNQRPDLYAAAREVEAAAADVDNARAQRLPRLSLGGSVSAARFEAGGLDGSGVLWSIGPLSVTLPLFDAGSRAANVDAARARYDAAVSAYRGQLRGAVREVEEALVQLQSAGLRNDDAAVAAQGFEAFYRAVDARHRGGLASLFELEDARRNAVQAQRTLLDLQREQVAAWLTLYRALGGGWRADMLQTAASAPP